MRDTCVEAAVMKSFPKFVNCAWTSYLSLSMLLKIMFISVMGSAEI
jgi:hypothetical protein